MQHGGHPMVRLRDPPPPPSGIPVVISTSVNSAISGVAPFENGRTSTSTTFTLAGRMCFFPHLLPQELPMVILRDIQSDLEIALVVALGTLAAVMTLLVCKMYYLRFSLQVLCVYLGCQFYHPNINYRTQKLYLLKVETPKFMLVYFL